MTRSVEESIYAETARKHLNQVGFAQAVSERMRMRDENSQGTASYCFHNAVLKEIRRQHAGIGS